MTEIEQLRYEIELLQRKIALLEADRDRWHAFAKRYARAQETRDSDLPAVSTASQHAP